MAKDIFKSLENEMLVYKNNLIGYYNANNLYMVNPEIVDNLIEYPKVIDKFKDSSILCSCYLVGFGTISFEIEVAKENSNIVSTMYLLENTTRVNGYLSANLKTPLVQFVAKEEKDFVQRIIYAFNLTEDSAVLEQPKEDDKSYIFMRKTYNQHMFESIKDDCNNEFKTLVDAQLTYLKKGKNPFTKDVLQQFKDNEGKLKDKYLKIGRTIDYFAMYQLLMSCVDSVLKKNPSYDKYYKEYSKNLLIATQFALRAIRSFNTKFKNGAFKKIDATKSHSLTKIATNKELLTTNTKEKTHTVLKMGDVLEDGYIDSIRQWRGFRGGMHRFPRFHELQHHEHDERCKICESEHGSHTVARVGNFMSALGNFHNGNGINPNEFMGKIVQVMDGFVMSPEPAGYNEKISQGLEQYMNVQGLDPRNPGQVFANDGFAHWHEHGHDHEHGHSNEHDGVELDDDYEDEIDVPGHDID